MAEETRIESLLDELNASFGDQMPYKLAWVRSAELTRLQKNARYMPKGQYDRLVANIKRDANLSSLPFCWRQLDGSFVVLSGNHRVMAAVDAGVERVLILYTDAELSRSERVAIQLSHNAIVGKDDPQMLRQLWEEILLLELKEYSGLDEAALDSMKVSSAEQVGAAGLEFEEVRLLFLPHEVDEIERVVKRLGKGRRWAARVEDFDRFFDALLAFKEAAGMLNTATAFVGIVEIVQEWLLSAGGESADDSQ